MTGGRKGLTEDSQEGGLFNLRKQRPRGLYRRVHKTSSVKAEAKQNGVSVVAGNGWGCPTTDTLRRVSGGRGPGSSPLPLQQQGRQKPAGVSSEAPSAEEGACTPAELGSSFCLPGGLEVGFTNQTPISASSQGVLET